MINSRLIEQINQIKEDLRNEATKTRQAIALKEHMETEYTKLLEAYNQLLSIQSAHKKSDSVNSAKISAKSEEADKLRARIAELEQERVEMVKKYANLGASTGSTSSTITASSSTSTVTSITPVPPTSNKAEPRYSHFSEHFNYRQLNAKLNAKCFAKISTRSKN